MNDSLFNTITTLILIVSLTTIILSITFVIRLMVFLFHRKTKTFPRKNLLFMITGMILSSLYYYNLVFNMAFLPQGQLNQTIPSSTGQYEIKTYNLSGYFDYKSVRVEILDTNTTKSSTIYYDNIESGPIEVKWLDEDTVLIQGKAQDISSNN